MAWGKYYFVLKSNNNRICVCSTHDSELLKNISKFIGSIRSMKNLKLNYIVKFNEYFLIKIILLLLSMFLLNAAI